MNVPQLCANMLPHIFFCPSPSAGIYPPCEKFTHDRAPDLVTHISASGLSEAALSDLPYINFLASYPYPAFIFAAVPARGKERSSLHPIYANAAFHLLFPDDADDHPDYLFIQLFKNSTQTHSFGQWLMESSDPKFLLELSVGQLELIKTRMEDFWVCTSVPRTPLVTLRKPTRSRRPSPGALSDFPQHGNATRSTMHMESIPTGAGTISELIETFDWANSPLGARESWPQSLKSALGACLSAQYPSALWWGPELVLIYNDAYIKTAGLKHPRIWGQAGPIAWAEIWEQLGGLAKGVFDGVSVWKENDLFMFEKLTEANLPEENYYDWSYRPIYQEDGKVGGLINDCFDVTDKVIAERRMDCLRDLITATILTTSPKEFSDSVVNALSKEAYAIDISFAALYTCSSDSAVDPISGVSLASPNSVGVQLELVRTIGIPAGHPSASSSVSLKVNFATNDSVEGLPPLEVIEALRALTPPSQRRKRLGSPQSTTGSSFTETERIKSLQKRPTPWPFQEAIQTHRCVHVPHLADYIVEGFDKRGWGDRPREAVVIPLGLDDQKVPPAILVIGINTRRPYDRNYRNDMDIIRMTLSSTLNATLGREAEVKRAEQLAELDAAKTAFFSNISHELRTPLTLIGGPLEDCISQMPDGTPKNNLKMAQRNTSRLARLVDSLMDFSKIAANKLEGQFRPVQLGLFTANLASLFRSPVEQSGMTYNIKCSKNPEQPICYVDPDFWEKIVFNLIGNAFKYTFEGSVTVSVKYTDTHAKFSVKDTGVGIPSEDIPKLFQRFHRVQSTSRSHEGTGIGLALTKELTALHGGELTVESSDDEDNHGSTFTVSIPLGKAHLPQANIFESPSERSRQGVYARGVIDEASMWMSSAVTASGEETPASDLGSSGSSGDSGRLDPSIMFFSKSDVVLLVDDNGDMRRYTKSILSRYCTVVEARHGKEALDIAISIRPNLVLSDVMMPVMDGLTLLKELRDRKETNLIPIILVTARSGDDSRVEGLLSGADDYLAKPFKSAELIARVHLQMQLGKKRADLEDRFMERTMEIQQLSELSPVAIFRADPSGRISYVNPKWYDITGHPRDDDWSQWIENVHEEHEDMVRNWWLEVNDRSLEQESIPGEHENAPQEQKSAPKTIEFRWKKGEWCQAQCAPIEEKGLLGVFTDISQRKKLEAMQLTHALERAEQAEMQRKDAEERRRSQELLIDVTSHELRQPVSAILNCSSLVRTNLSALRDEIQSVGAQFRPTPKLLNTMQEDLEALDAIYQCGLAQERIANDVLSLSRIQLNVLSIHPVEFDLVQEIKRITSLFRNETDMKHIRLQVNIGESLQRIGITRISADRVRFDQVITNLLSNAIKFTDMSANQRNILIEVQVSMTAPSPDSCAPPEELIRPAVYPVPPDTPIFIFVSVTDSGPGLQPEDLMLLFKRFQQGSNSHDVFGGSGLGLFVSRKLCDLMGGRIEVSSVYGNGATFRFFIQSITSAPLLKSRTQPLSLATGASLPTRPLHILITEDNLINQTVLNRQLMKAGCTTRLANNGQQALDILKTTTQPFDAILMDVEMPVLDGLSTVREIRRMEANGELPRQRVFALTGNAREGQIQNIRQAGMDDVMIKPYRIEDVLFVLRSP